jgi:hypothetical protein
VPVKFKGRRSSHLKFQPTVWWNLVVDSSEIELHEHFYLTTHVCDVSPSVARFAPEYNLCCIRRVFGRLLQSSLRARLSGASWGINSCTDWVTWGYNCISFNARCTEPYELQDVWYWWEPVVQRSWGSNLSPVPYVQNVDDQHPIAFHEMFPALGVSDQRKAKDEIWHSPIGVFCLATRKRHL